MIFQTLDNSFGMDILASLLGGIITAGLFFIIFRPRVKFSDKIAKSVNDKGETIYKFKFYNKSLSGAVNVVPTLFWGKSTEEGDINVNIEYKQLELTRVEPFYLPKWKRTTKKTKHAPHCITIRCKDQDFLEILQTYGSIIEFRVTLTHRFSNITTTRTKKFNRVKLIKEGKFDFGNTTTITKLTE